MLAVNTELRDGLTNALKLDVSRGRDITKAAMLFDVIARDRIGGDRDDRTALTQRILFLTESAQVGGGWNIRDVRREIIDAYADERSAGRHPLAFCNDLARYYRTVCMDYKSRVDTVAADDWCTRNVKLRHSRKFWYFASLMATGGVTRFVRPDDTNRFIEAILTAFEAPPYRRLFDAVEPSGRTAVGRVIDQYAWYLDYMSHPDRRSRLALVTHDGRYSVDDGNPYPGLQWNAMLMHRAMISVVDGLDRETRDRITDWFFL